MTTQPITKSIGRSPQWRGVFILIPLLFSYVLLSPEVKAQCTGCFTTNCDTFPISDVAPAPCLGCDGREYLGNTAYGCSSLVHATITACDDNTCGPDGGHYTGANMSFNTAFGSHALYSNTGGGNYNTAFGAFSLYSNTTSSQNTAVGYGALQHISTVGQSTAVGYQALVNSTSGRNEAFGASALFHNTIGIGNVAVGGSALVGDTTGFYNVSFGDNAGAHLTTGNGNVCIGYNVLGVAGESNTTRIRNVYSSVASGRAVYVNSDNKIGTLSSSRRYKEEIKPMDKASKAILALKPVTFRYKPEVDPAHVPMFGLVAEDVEKVNRDLVSYNEKGEAEAVRYDAVNAMLLNEFLKEHRKVQELEKARADEQNEIAELKQQIKALASGLEKVTVQVELNKPAPRTIADNQ